MFELGLSEYPERVFSRIGERLLDDYLKPSLLLNDSQWFMMLVRLSLLLLAAVMESTCAAPPHIPNLLLC